MRTRLAALLLLGALVRPAPADDYPHVELKTPGLALTVYLPDAEKGFYRGTRFDWSGVLGHVKFAGHTLFGPWKPRHDPANFEDAVGPVEEFGTEKPLGYDEAKVGETFLKIGVGELVKPKEEKYSFFTNYKIARPETWEVKAGERSVAFVQKFAVRGYGYEYTKTVSLGDESAGFRIVHAFKNTGDKQIETDVYNHNFLNVDGDPVGPNYRFEFPFTPTAAESKERFREVVELTGKELRFTKPLDKGSAWVALAGFDDKTPSGFVFRHLPSKIKVTVTGQFPTKSVAPLSRFNFWATKLAACPEPFHVIRVKPGETAKWGWEYRFETE